MRHLLVQGRRRRAGRMILLSVGVTNSIAAFRPGFLTCFSAKGTCTGYKSSLLGRDSFLEFFFSGTFFPLLQEQESVSRVH